MKKTTTRRLIACSILFFSAWLPAAAQVLDPETYIREKGYKSVRVGDDGVTPFYTAMDRATASRLAELERGIAGLPKRIEVFQVCEQTRGSVKAKIIAERGVAIDVATPNYGYSGSTIACVLKYMHENRVGTQLMYMKKASGSMYMLFVTD